MDTLSALFARMTDADKDALKEASASAWSGDISAGCDGFAQDCWCEDEKQGEDGRNEQ